MFSLQSNLAVLIAVAGVSLVRRMRRYSATAACVLWQVTQIMVPLLKFYFHEEVRQAAVQAVPELLKSVYMAVSEGKAGGADMQYVKQMLDYVWQPLIDSMVKVGQFTSCPSLRFYCQGCFL